MRNLIVTAAAVGALSFAGLGLAGVAAAVPLSSTSATDAVVVQSDGSAAVQVSRCAVTNSHGLPVFDSAGRLGAVRNAFAGTGC
jgi:hypothetical protein